MTAILIEFACIAVGLIFSALLFYRFPILPSAKGNPDGLPSVSIIIPARNEEDTLPLLLQDLKEQTLPVLEIICVDDASEDATAQIASSFGARLISLDSKPEGWTGKSWACQNGATVAKGDLLLFLDADVRLGRDGVLRLMQAYVEVGCTVSVQPYHVTEDKYEQFSLLFNLVQIAANGAALPKPLSIGLYGPIILIPHADYDKVGGHQASRHSVIEDIALGMQLKRAGIPYRLFLGDEAIAFRMYGGGFNSLVQGWVKNLASGAVKTPPLVFLMVFLWVTSLTSVPIQLIKAVTASNIPLFAVYSVLYIIWVIVLVFLAHRVGRFQIWSAVLYPVSLFVFLLVFFISMFRKIFKLKVTWKGRQIETGQKPCD